jgi:hypothetical protein
MSYKSRKANTFDFSQGKDNNPVEGRGNPSGRAFQGEPPVVARLVIGAIFWAGTGACPYEYGKNSHIGLLRNTA